MPRFKMWMDGLGGKGGSTTELQQWLYISRDLWERWKPVFLMPNPFPDGRGTGMPRVGFRDEEWPNIPGAQEAHLYEMRRREGAREKVWPTC